MQQDNTIAALNELVSIHLAARCVNNGEFMAAMRDDAKAAVISCLPEGLSIGDDIAVRAEQNTADVMHICVPDYSVLEHLGENLTDEQLAKISGGAFEITCALSVIGVVTSPTGAVIRDILHRLSDRFGVRVLLLSLLPI